MAARRRCKLCRSTTRELRETHYALIPAVVAAGRAAGVDAPPSWVCTDSQACTLDWPAGGPLR